jgi:ribosomal-protein-alanine N-acetyltransferase
LFKCEGNIPVIEGERIKLRKIEANDADTLLQYWGDPEVVKEMNMSPFMSSNEVLEMITLLNGLAECEDTLRWGIELREEHKLIGSCGFNTWQLSGAYRAEIGYDLGKAYWRQGYMTEALGLMLSYGYETMGLNRIEALVQPTNVASSKLLTSFHFQQEGLLRQYQKIEEGFMDLYLYSLLKEEFELI